MVTKFFFGAGHPSLDFVNTQMRQNGAPLDLLATWHDVVVWAREAGLLSEVEAASCAATDEAALRAALALRKELRAMATGLARGEPVAAPVVGLLNRHLARGTGRACVVAGEAGFELRFETPLRDGADVVARIAASAANLLCEADLTRVKACGNPDCVLVFLDTTKNGARHWCSMDLCGNRHKAARHYARRKSGAE